MSMTAGLLALSEEQAAQLCSKPKTIPEFIFRQTMQGSDSYADLYKNWHGLHFLLTESNWHGEEPFKSVILGGDEIGPDVGYGPARILSPEKVKEIYEALNNVDKEVLRARFDKDKMYDMEIYASSHWDEESLVELLEVFEIVRRFYKSAAEEGKSVLQFLQ